MGKLAQSTKRGVKATPGLFVVLGCALILCSGICFFTMLAVPIFKMSAAAKGMLGGALFVGVQVGWWVGVALIGPSAIGRIRDFFSRASKTQEADEREIETDEPFEG